MDRFDINRYFTDDIENENHPSIFETAENYSVLIIKLPVIKTHMIKTISYAFLIKDGIHIYSREKKNFEPLGGFDKLHSFIDTKIDNILNKLSLLDNEIVSMENDLYDGKINKTFANRWLIFKKELILIERLMEHLLVAFGQFIKHYKDKTDSFAFRDLNEHIERAYRYSVNATRKLDYLYSFYTAKISNKMNNIIFFLTVLSGVFFPLTLITGFFGMNTGGLPLEHDPSGTLKVGILFFLFEVPFILLLWQLIKKH